VVRGIDYHLDNSPQADLLYRLIITVLDHTQPPAEEPPLPKIRSLAYVLPVIEELELQPLPDGYLQNVPDRHPVNAGKLHRNGGHVQLLQPGPDSDQGRLHGPEALANAMALGSIGGHDVDDDSIFMNINAAAAAVYQCRYSKQYSSPWLKSAPLLRSFDAENVSS
jgi:hypothetical protein